MLTLVAMKYCCSSVTQWSVATKCCNPLFLFNLCWFQWV